MVKFFQQPLTKELKQKIEEGFKRHSLEVMGKDGLGEPLAFVALEEDDYIGAVVAQYFWGALHIKYVWVEASYRKQQIGKRLLAEALHYGQRQNCCFAFVETMSFQALEFYQKQGFVLEFTRKGYAEGLSLHYLKRDFSSKDVTIKSLSEIPKESIIELMNHPKVRSHMPLLKGIFDEASYRSFIQAKQKIWDEHGYGPSAFTLNDDFMGWGGLQPFNDDVEIALVLHPKYWGCGKYLYKKIIDFAFGELKLSSVIILFPSSRIKIGGLLKLGFKLDGNCDISGESFLRYRLLNKNLEETHGKNP